MTDYINRRILDDFKTPELPMTISQAFVDSVNRSATAASSAEEKATAVAGAAVAAVAMLELKLLKLMQAVGVTEDIPPVE